MGLQFLKNYRGKRYLSNKLYKFDFFYYKLIKSNIHSMKIHHCEISDSFVHPNNKLSNGKNGHGEARLYLSASETILQTLSSKPWKVNFDSNYIDDISDFMKDTNKFIKPHDHLSETIKNIKLIDNKVINLKPQQGNTDCRRNYVGPINDKPNKDNWKYFRNSLAPIKTTLEFYDSNGTIIVKVIHNKNVKKYNKPPGCSFISLDWLSYMEKKHNIEIQHAMNGGEHKERKDNGYFAGVDGYHECGKHKCDGTKENPCQWNKTVFEFQGDYWHRNKQIKDKEKKEAYEKKGYKVYVIWEHEFIQIKKTMKENNRTK